MGSSYASRQVSKELRAPGDAVDCGACAHILKTSKVHNDKRGRFLKVTVRVCTTHLLLSVSPKCSGEIWRRAAGGGGVQRQVDMGLENGVSESHQRPSQSPLH